GERSEPGEGSVTQKDPSPASLRSAALSLKGRGRETPLRILFVKESQNWPRASGHDVHGYHMMKALADRGHMVSLATVTPPTPQALDGLPLTGCFSLASGGTGLQTGGLSSWQRRMAHHYPFEERWGAALGAILRDRPFDAVVVVARHLLPLLS